jgi:hypothetical protein
LARLPFDALQWIPAETGFEVTGAGKQVLPGNLCGDERDEAVIVYTCETGVDRWNQYLAVFLEIEDEPLVQEIGNSEYRQVSSYYINDLRVLIETEKIDPDEDVSAAQHPVIKYTVPGILSPD